LYNGVFGGGSHAHGGRFDHVAASAAGHAGAFLKPGVVAIHLGARIREKSDFHSADFQRAPGLGGLHHVALDERAVAANGETVHAECAIGFHEPDRRGNRRRNK
jgi:hypothetical protein